MPKENFIIKDGVVTEALPNTMFRVEVDEGNLNLLCVVSGKMRQNFIKIVSGDKVRLEISPYDLTRGRIVCRL